MRRSYLLGWPVRPRERPLLTLLCERPAGALQRAVDGRHGVVEQVGDLARRPVEYVTQHEHGALLGRQHLHRGNERQADCLPRLGDIVRLRRGAAQRAVGVRLEVGVDGRGRATALLDHAQAHVGRDPVEPRGERRARLEAADAAPRPQKRLLQCVVGVVDRAEHAIAVDVQRGAVGCRQIHEGALLAGAGRGHDGVMVRRRRHEAGTGGGPPSCVHGEAANVPGTPPRATNRTPSGPGRTRRSCSGPTRAGPTPRIWAPCPRRTPPSGRRSARCAAPKWSARASPAPESPSGLVELAFTWNGTLTNPRARAGAAVRGRRRSAARVAPGLPEPSEISA
jgi:hypothetical protein